MVCILDGLVVGVAALAVAAGEIQIFAYDSLGRVQFLRRGKSAFMLSAESRFGKKKNEPMKQCEVR